MHIPDIVINLLKPTSVHRGIPIVLKLKGE